MDPPPARTPCTPGDPEGAASAAPVEEPITTALKIDDVKIELGYALLPLVNSPHGADRLT